MTGRRRWLVPGSAGEGQPGEGTMVASTIVHGRTSWNPYRLLDRAGRRPLVGDYIQPARSAAWATPPPKRVCSQPRRAGRSVQDERAVGVDRDQLDGLEPDRESGLADDGFGQQLPNPRPHPWSTRTGPTQAGVARLHWNVPSEEAIACTRHPRIAARNRRDRVHRAAAPARRCPIRRSRRHSHRGGAGHRVRRRSHPRPRRFFTDPSRPHDGGVARRR